MQNGVVNTMGDIHIRQATMDDTVAIGELFRQHIPVWQRLDADGQVVELPYDALTLHERWLHGGAWMTLETSALFLSHLLTGAGLPMVALVDEMVAGYVEVYPGSEPDPFGTHYHIAQIMAIPNGKDVIKDALMRHLFTLDIARLTVSFSSYDTDSAKFFAGYGMSLMTRVNQHTVPAQAGQGFYKAIDDDQAAPAHIEGWHMPVGRLQSARQHWGALWPRLWAAFPEITARKTQRLRFSAAGQEAFVCFQQQLYTPRCADVYCWSPRPLTQQLATAIRDWAYREGYRSLIFTVPDSTIKLLGTEYETNPYGQDIFAADVS